MKLKSKYFFLFFMCLLSLQMVLPHCVLANAIPTIKSANSGVGINFNLTTNSIISTVLHIDSAGTVGVGFNNVAPLSTLDVKGTLTVKPDTTNGIPGSIAVTGTTTSTWTYGTLTSTATGSIVTQGGLFVAGTSIFVGNSTSYGQSVVNSLDVNGNPIAGAVILPGYSTSSTEAAANNIPTVSAGLYDIGSPTRSFRNVYAQNFSGNFSGTFTGTLQGSISGTAAALDEKCKV